MYAYFFTSDLEKELKRKNKGTIYGNYFLSINHIWNLQTIEMEGLYTKSRENKSYMESIFVHKKIRNNQMEAQHMYRCLG
jgi:hypothetical protein